MAMMKSRMKKLSSIFSVVLTGAVYFFASSAVYAQSICPSGQFSNLCSLSLNNASNLVGNVVTILLIIAVILALFFLIWGGIRWITSGGDKGKVDAARQTITAAIVGLILAFLAYAILNIILLIFTGKTATTFTIPTLY